MRSKSVIVPSGLRDLFLWCMPFLAALPFRRRTIMRNGKPYLTRIYLTPSTGRLGKWWRNRFCGRFLHCFHMSDPDGLHNHPWKWARSVILRGAYVEVRCSSPTPAQLELVNRGEWRPIPRIFWPGDSNELTEATWHRVDLMSDEVWTLFTVGPRHGKGWGFSTGRKGTSDEA